MTTDDDEKNNDDDAGVVMRKRNIMPSTAASSSGSNQSYHFSYITLAWTEAMGGAVAGALADAILYGVDSAKVQSQQATTTTTTSSSTSSTSIRTSGTSSTRSGAGGRTGIRILFRGLVPTILLGSVPSLGGFFFLYAPIKQYIIDNNNHNTSSISNSSSNGNSNSSGAATWWLLPLASGVCAIPATLLGVPADVIKKRLVLGLDPTVTSAIRTVLAANHGSIYRGLFAGWHVNLIRDIPFAGIKIGLYELLVSYYVQHCSSSSSSSISAAAEVDEERRKEEHHHQHPTKKLSVVGATLCGLASGVGCAILTAPLDVVNTRIKATTRSSTSIRVVVADIIRNEGITALFRGVLMRSFTLGVGSSIFWPIQRTTANYLQQQPQPQHQQQQY